MFQLLTLPPPQKLLYADPGPDPVMHTFYATLQGLWNKSAPNGMLYLDYDQHAVFWREYYTHKVQAEPVVLTDILFTAEALGLARRFILFDPASPQWKINSYCTIAGQYGDCLVAPLSMGNYLKKIGLTQINTLVSNDRLGQIKLDFGKVLASCRKGSFVYNHGQNSAPGLYELATAFGVFCTDLSPSIVGEETALYSQMLDVLGPGTMMYGWMPFLPDVSREWDHLKALSEHNSGHSGVGQVSPAVKIGNTSVHVAMSCYYPASYTTRHHDPPTYLLNNLSKVKPIAVFLGEGDQTMAVGGGLWPGKEGKSLWADRGELPLTWTINPLWLPSGIYHYLHETLHPNDDLVAVAPGPYCYPKFFPSGQTEFHQEIDLRLRAAALSSVMFPDNADPTLALQRLAEIPNAHVIVDGYDPYYVPTTWNWGGNRFYKGVDFMFSFTGKGLMGDPISAARLLHFGSGKRPGLKDQLGVPVMMHANAWDCTIGEIKTLFNELNRLARVNKEDPDAYVAVNMRNFHLLTEAMHHKAT